MLFSTRFFRCFLLPVRVCGAGGDTGKAGTGGNGAGGGGEACKWNLLVDWCCQMVCFHGVFQSLDVFFHLFSCFFFKEENNHHRHFSSTNVFFNDVPIFLVVPGVFRFVLMFLCVRGNDTSISGLDLWKNTAWLGKIFVKMRKNLLANPHFGQTESNERQVLPCHTTLSPSPRLFRKDLIVGSRS